MISVEDEAIGFWLSAALEDDDICNDFRQAIRNWFDQPRIKEGLKEIMKCENS